MSTPGPTSGNQANAPGEVTRLLVAYSAGDRDAFDKLIPLVYDDLRRIAHKRLRSAGPDQTLRTTAVVHEAYLHMVNQSSATWQDRTHFFAVASKVIRGVIVDYARRRGAEKRGGAQIRIPLSEGIVGSEPRLIDFLALEDALQALAERDRRLEAIVECRFFGGMSMKETATALGVSTRTAERDWRRAKSYLYDTLNSEHATGIES